MVLARARYAFKEVTTNDFTIKDIRKENNMKMYKLIIATCGITLIAGCMTVEEQLNSPDPAVRARANKKLEGIALDSSEWASASRIERIGAINQINDQDTLVRILTARLNDGRFNGKALDEMFRTDADVYGPCIDRLDQDHLVEFILFESKNNPLYNNKNNAGRRGRRKGFDEGDNIGCDDPERFSAEMLLQCGYDYGGRSELKSRMQDGWYNRMMYAISKLSDSEAIIRCFGKAKTFELKTFMFPLAFANWNSVQNKYELAAMLKVACKRQSYEADEMNFMFTDKMFDPKKYVVDIATKKGIVSKIADQGVYSLMLDRKSKYYIEDLDVILAIVDKMDKNKVYDIAMKRLNANDYKSWERDYMPLVQFTKAAYCKLDDETKKAALIDLMVAKISAYKSKNEWGGKGEEIEAEVQQAVDLWGEILPISAKTKLYNLFASERRRREIAREIREAKQGE